MIKFDFKFQNANGASGNNLFKVLGDEVEILENIWVEILGRKYDSRNDFGMMRERTDREVRLFEDFSGLLAHADGIILLDKRRKKIYVHNLSISSWFEQLNSLEGELKRAEAIEIAKKISRMRENSPLIIVAKIPKIIMDEETGDLVHDDFDDKETYGEYAGSYAQDEEGLSDNFIDDVLDGDPDAYWNID